MKTRIAILGLVIAASGLVGCTRKATKPAKTASAAHASMASMTEWCLAVQQPRNSDWTYCAAFTGQHTVVLRGPYEQLYTKHTVECMTTDQAGRTIPLKVGWEEWGRDDVVLTFEKASSGACVATGAGRVIVP